MARRFGAGISVNEDTLALDVMKRSAKTSGYLSEKHTIKNLRDEMWFPSLLERRSENVWRNAGSERLQDRIREKLKILLA